jgi:hypothetical protein
MPGKILVDVLNLEKEGLVGFTEEGKQVSLNKPITICSLDNFEGILEILGDNSYIKRGKLVYSSLGYNPFMEGKVYTTRTDRTQVNDPENLLYPENFSGNPVPNTPEKINPLSIDEDNIRLAQDQGILARKSVGN